MDVQPLRPRTGRLTLIFLVFVGVAVAVGSALSADSGETAVGGPMEGEIAPEVVLDGFDGEIWRLSGHLGTDHRPVVLNLWASWCEPCRDEIPELTAFARANPDFAVVGVAVRDQYEPAEEMVNQLDPGYLVGFDGTGRLRDRYVGFGMPATFVIDRQGVVRAQVEGQVTRQLLEDLVER